MDFQIIDDTGTPAHRSPAELNDLVVVKKAAATNDAGGTCLLVLPPEGLRVRVSKKFWDYETGWLFHGIIVAEADIDTMKKQTTTGFANVSDMKRSKVGPVGQYDPSKVYFSEHEIDRIEKTAKVAAAYAAPPF